MLPRTDPRLWLAAGAAAAALGLLAWLLYDTLFPVFIGFALAYAFDPAADRLQARGLSRTAAVVMVMTAVFAAAGLGLGLIIPKLFEEAREFAVSFPEHLGVALDKGQAWAAAWGLELPHDRAELLALARQWAQSTSLSVLAPAGSYAAKFFSGAAGMLVGTLNLILIPVVFFYFLRDISQIRAGVLELFPPRYRRWAGLHLDEADRVFGGYLRGQISVCLVLAVLYSVGLGLVGIRFGVLIGIFSGLLNFVPYLGVLSGLVLSLIMAAVDYSGLGPFIGVAAVFSIVQTLEGFVITPRIVGDRVGLSSLETIASLIVGGEFGGLAGMVLAIPLAGCLKVYLRDGFEAYRRSQLYRG